MTTAHRPTFHNALGGTNPGGAFLVAPSLKVCSRDLPSHKTLKFRQPGQASVDDLEEKDFKKVLFEKERENKALRAAERASTGAIESKPYQELVNHKPLAIASEAYVNPFPEDADDDPTTRGGARKIRADDPSSSSEAEDSDDDDEEELMRELARIKQEREEEERKVQMEKDKAQAEIEREKILRANPLLMGRMNGTSEGDASGGSGAISLKRRWDDDVVFKNQAKDLPKPKKRFINDTVRNKFHQKFLSKYIK